jgi:hypothetical protein
MLAFSICSCIFFRLIYVSTHHRIEQIAVFFISVARNKFRFELELRKDDNRVFALASRTMIS